MNMNILFTAVLFGFSVHAAPPAVSPSATPTTAHIYYFQTLAFGKGLGEISAGDLEAFAKLIQMIRAKKQKIEQAHVAVWSDKPFSSTSSLAQKDRDLADQRIGAIENHLESKYGIGNI